jgi:phage/plasmid-associated DNA primase
MALKTFNIDKKVYEIYSKHCRQNGISMSHQVENFLKKELDKIKFGVEKIEKVSEKHIVEMQKLAKEIEKAVEHPLQKYC